MGNRGCLHDGAGRIVRGWTTKAWIACRLSFRGRRRPLMQPDRYTELFFLDEAAALAAGHRPCAECRRADYLAFRDRWERLLGPVRTVAGIDAALQAARVDPATRRQRRHPADWATLPDGAFALHADQPHLVLGARLLPFAPGGYGAPADRPRGGVAQVLTPAPLLTLLRDGWTPALHDSAAAAAPWPGPGQGRNPT